MGFFTGFVVYVLVWWIVLFTVLPWRAAADKNPETGMAASAPVKTHMKMKLIVTTGLSAVIWGVIYTLIKMEIVNYRILASQM